MEYNNKKLEAQCQLYRIKMCIKTLPTHTYTVSATSHVLAPQT